MQGLLLPLCQSGSCTLREAVIVSSVINRVSIPVVHSAAALLRLAEMPYSGTTSFFIRVLLDKKYSMPYRVVSLLLRNRLRVSFAASQPACCLIAEVDSYEAYNVLSAVKGCAVQSKKDDLMPALWL